MNPFVDELPNPLIDGVVIGADTNPKKYHAPQLVPRGHPDYVMSFSELSLFNVCPRRWIDGYEEPSTQAREWGDPIDCLVLTPQFFSERFSISPETYTNKKGEVKPWRYGADVTDAWKELMERSGRTCIKFEMGASLNTAAKRFLADPYIKELLMLSDRQVQVMSRYVDPETGVVVPLKSLVDIVPRTDTPFGKCVAELKSATNGAMEPFTDAIWRYQYFVQLALYIDALKAAGQDRTDGLIIGQESFEPFQPFRRHVCAADLETGRGKYKNWLKRYAYCIRSGDWGDYEDGYQQLIPGFALVQFVKPWQML